MKESAHGGAREVVRFLAFGRFEDVAGSTATFLFLATQSKAAILVWPPTHPALASQTQGFTSTSLHLH
jgi:hypothetical protein